MSLFGVTHVSSSEDSKTEIKLRDAYTIIKHELDVYSRKEAGKLICCMGWRTVAGSDTYPDITRDAYPNIKYVSRKMRPRKA